MAALGYLADRPIHSLTDLAQAQWIAHSRLSSPLSWLVATPQREAVLFKVADAATLTGDSAAALLAFALHGTGWRCCRRGWHSRNRRRPAAAVAAGSPFPEQSIYALYPNTRHVPEKVRAFIDFCARG